MTAVSKNVSFDVLNDIVDNYNNTYHKTIKPYAEYNVDSNEKDPKLKAGDFVRISKYKKDMLLISQLKFLQLAKLKIQFHGLVINDFNGEEISGKFYKKELQKANQKHL